ncbi:phage tail assembly chaperone [Roseibium litorale]|uniref:Phage tail assembly chaperone n=1 Tax=Roseibium litorale TaxID=2803841 RepID=A0ABR9CRV9_9HYPH|nr:phage tail assembly chaperone [Roseibium litorale]MBD8893493.1 phage tail assembly chaperone [Roseibium litorale]
MPWQTLMERAMGGLCWRPADFWAATPRELAAALGLIRQKAALGRRDFDRLMGQFPDRLD